MAYFNSMPSPNGQRLLNLPPGVESNLHSRDVGMAAGGEKRVGHTESPHVDSGAELDSQPDSSQRRP